jgi:hypothetical protein
MKEIPLIDGPVDVVGALDLDRNETGWIPRRLPAWTRPQIPDLFMDVVVQLPSGVRLRLATTATTLELDVMLTNLCRPPLAQRPAVFDLVVDSTLLQQPGTMIGNLITLGQAANEFSFDVGEPTTITFSDLPAGHKVVEIWLPQASVVELRAFRVDDEAEVASAPDSGTRTWVHYGSSISHCVEADSPTGTWPALAAFEAGVDLFSLGLAGQCTLDQFVARTIRDLPADVISLKVGINLVNGDTMRERAFGPALHGFLDTVREGHRDTPILLVSPIFCPSAEDRPGPTVPGAAGKFVTVEGLEDLRLTCLTLTKIRTLMAAVVQTRRSLGDANLHYLNGLELFGASDAGDLPDDLHPNPAGYARMASRFTSVAFGPGGALAQA